LVGENSTLFLFSALLGILVEVILLHISRPTQLTQQKIFHNFVYYLTMETEPVYFNKKQNDGRSEAQ